MSDKTLFQQLYDINVNDKLEKKANLSYLSWAWAWAEVKKIDPNTSAEIHEFPLPNVEGIKVPYLQTPTGYFVKVSVTIKGQTETEWLPVMDHRNKTIEKPNAFDINKTTKRCLVKAIALHGLGLYVYAGEDLPEIDVGESNGNQTNNINKPKEELPLPANATEGAEIVLTFGKHEGKKLREIFKENKSYLEWLGKQDR
ncbi:Sak single strand annealing protein [Bacillus mycoides]